MKPPHETVTSADGTPIALERRGEGSPVVLVGGAYNDRSTVAGVADVLASSLMAVVYDRRGRGDSGDGEVYEVERELEDLAAVIGHVGGTAAVFGHSSGGNLVLEAAVAGLPIDRLAAYEPVYILEGTRPAPGPDLGERLRALLAEGRRDDAVVLFQTEAIGLPSEAVDHMRSSEVWGWLTGLAHTLPFDVAICASGYVADLERLGAIHVPTLAIDGGDSPEWIRAGSRSVAGAIPGARYETLQGEDHAVLNRPEALRHVLKDFFV